jgi:hypothetical protein
MLLGEWNSFGLQALSWNVLPSGHIGLLTTRRTSVNFIGTPIVWNTTLCIETGFLLFTDFPKPSSWSLWATTFQICRYSVLKGITTGQVQWLNPSYLEGRDPEDRGLRSAWAKSLCGSISIPGYGGTHLSLQLGEGAQTGGWQSRLDQAIKRDLISKITNAKRACRAAQEVEHLLSKNEALSSTPWYWQKEKNYYHAGRCWDSCTVQKAVGIIASSFSGKVWQHTSGFSWPICKVMPTLKLRNKVRVEIDEVCFCFCVCFFYFREIMLLGIYTDTFKTTFNLHNRVTIFL